nr:hypothetical protein [Myxococcota bacterium]
TLRGAPITLTRRDEVGEAGDVVVRVRLGGYGVARGRGRALTIPRVRRDEGLSFDLEALDTTVTRMPHRRVAIEWMATVRAADLFDAAFRLGGEPDGLLVAI